MPQPALLQLSGRTIQPCNLLEARVIATTYNDQVRLLSPEPFVGWHHKVYPGVGTDIVMESVHQLHLGQAPGRVNECNRLRLRRLKLTPFLPQ